MRIKFYLIGVGVGLTCCVAGFTYMSYRYFIAELEAADMRIATQLKAMSERCKREQSTQIDEIYSRGYDRFTKDDYEGAIVDLKKVIELDPNYLHARKFLAASYNNRALLVKKRNADPRGTLADLDEAIRILPLPNFYHNRAHERGENHNAKGALSDINEAIRLNSKDGSLYKTRRDIRRELGDKDGATADDIKSRQLSEINTDDCGRWIDLSELQGVK